MNDTMASEEARLWAIRVLDPGFADWDAMTQWLESDPAHLAAYEAALEDDAWAAAALDQASEARSPAEDEPDIGPQRRRTRWFAAGGAIAAAIAGIATWVVLDANPAMREIETAPGEHRQVELADGSSVVLNGATSLVFDPAKPREVVLARGEALFNVRHDEQHPFVVIAGDTRLLDVGTVFNVVREGDGLDVAVAEGAVIYQPGREDIRLGPGDALSRPSRSVAPVLRRTNALAVGSWKSGVLQYDNAPLDLVAGDIGRNIGRPVIPASGANRLRFTGTLVVKGPADQVLSRAGPLLGVKFAPVGEAWTMMPENAEIP